MAEICEHYPCHKSPCIGFNCDFCYCPLYDDVCESYGGNPLWIKSGFTKIKDCTECQLPHLPEFKEIKDERIQEVLKRKTRGCWE